MARSSITKRSTNTFGNLIVGDIFKYKEHPYMKTFIDARRSQNAVNLDKGTLQVFNDDDEVEVDVEITLKNK